MKTKKALVIGLLCLLIAAIFLIFARQVDGLMYRQAYPYEMELKRITNDLLRKNQVIAEKKLNGTTFPATSPTNVISSSSKPTVPATVRFFDFDLGYEITYPGNYILKRYSSPCLSEENELGSNVIMRNTKITDEISNFEIFINDPDDTCISNKFSSAGGPKALKPKLLVTEKTSVNGYPVLKRTYAHLSPTEEILDLRLVTLRFQNNEKTYTFLYNVRSGVHSDETEKIVGSVLSTFRFISDPMHGINFSKFEKWKKYENKEWAFRIKYPPEMNIDRWQDYFAFHPFSKDDPVMKEEGSVLIEMRVSQRASPMDKLIQERKEAGLMDFEQTSINLGKIQAQKITATDGFAGGKFFEIYISQGSKTLVFEYADNPHVQNTFEKMLETVDIN